jgi:hypothetical protein
MDQSLLPATSKNPLTSPGPRPSFRRGISSRHHLDEVVVQVPGEMTQLLRVGEAERPAFGEHRLDADHLVGRRIEVEIGRASPVRRFRVVGQGATGAAERGARRNADSRSARRRSDRAGGAAR